MKKNDFAPASTHSPPLSFRTVRADDDALVLSGVRRFRLRDIFECGQCFSFRKMPDGAYAGVARGHYLSLRQDGDTVVFAHTDEQTFRTLWYDYFDLGFDYEACAERFSGEPTLKKAAEFSKGIRILHQDFWETLCTFILSQNNNIPRIGHLVEALSRTFGTYLCTDGYGDRFTFPTPEALLEAGEPALRALKTGFRAGYLLDAAEKAAGGALNQKLFEDPSVSTEDALRALSRIRGVGPKVASCVLLFSCRRYDCFPVDVWMKRVLSAYYPGVSDGKAFGPYAGIAQQYLFYYERCRKSKMI